MAAIPPLPRAEPPFWGTALIDPLPLEELLDLINQHDLLIGWWRAKPKNASAAEWERLRQGIYLPILDRLKQTHRTSGVLTPRGVHGYFLCRPRGESLEVFIPTPQEGSSIAPPQRTPDAVLSFPRGREGTSVADYFATDHPSGLQVLPLQAVTVGPGATIACDALMAADDYTEYLYLHGLAVELAEAAAEWTHRRVRTQLRLPTAVGKRYSWGYPSCPSTEEQRIVERLLQTSRIGLELTAGAAWLPEQSTAAVVTLHPQARYWNR